MRINEKIKKIKKIDKKLKQSFTLNDNRTNKNEVIIDVNIGDYKTAYSKYSVREDLRITPSLLDYIVKEHPRNLNPVIYIYNEELVNKEGEQKLFKLTLKNELTMMRVNKYSEMKYNTAWTIIYALLAISLIISSQFIPTNILFVNMLADLIVILEWVCGWAFVDLLLVRHKIKKEYLNIAKLSYSDILFFKNYTQGNVGRDKKESAPTFL